MARFGPEQLRNQTSTNSSVYVCVVCTYMFPCSPQVVVSVGGYLSSTPGSITFLTSTSSQFPVAGVAGGVVGGAVFLGLLILAVISVVRRRESVMKSQVDVLMMQMKTLAEEPKGGKCCTLCVRMCVCAYRVHFVCILCAHACKCVNISACMCGHVYFSKSCVIYSLSHEILSLGTWLRIWKL